MIGVLAPIRPSLTPLVDVVFILLFFFLLTSVVDESASIETPPVVGQGSDTDSEVPIVLTATTNAEVLWLGQHWSLNRLIPRITGTQQRPVLLSAAPDLSVEHTLQVRDRLISAGHHQVFLVAEPKR